MRAHIEIGFFPILYEGTNRLRSGDGKNSKVLFCLPAWLLDSDSFLLQGGCTHVQKAFQDFPHSSRDVPCPGSWQNNFRWTISGVTEKICTWSWEWGVNTVQQPSTPRLRVEAVPSGRAQTSNHCHNGHIKLICPWHLHVLDLMDYSRNMYVFCCVYLQSEMTGNCWWKMLWTTWVRNNATTETCSFAEVILGLIAICCHIHFYCWCPLLITACSAWVCSEPWFMAQWQRFFTFLRTAGWPAAQNPRQKWCPRNRHTMSMTAKTVLSPMTRQCHWSSLAAFPRSGNNSHACHDRCSSWCSLRWRNPSHPTIAGYAQPVGSLCARIKTSSRKLASQMRSSTLPSLLSSLKLSPSMGSPPLGCATRTPLRSSPAFTFPQCSPIPRFVLMVRDGRAVVHSIISRKSDNLRVRFEQLPRLPAEVEPSHGGDVLPVPADRLWTLYAGILWATDSASRGVDAEDTGLSGTALEPCCPPPWSADQQAWGYLLVQVSFLALDNELAVPGPFWFDYWHVVLRYCPLKQIRCLPWGGGNDHDKRFAAGLWLSLVTWASFHQPLFCAVKMPKHVWHMLNTFVINSYDAPGISLEPNLVSFP